MAKKTRLSHLREHLFATLEALSDPDNPMDIERAKTVAEVSQVIINTAKVELDYLKLVDTADQPTFFDAEGTVPIATTNDRLPLLRAAGKA